MTKVVLVGNPNSGKSTVFNALTGGQQRVGNWSGVTVDCQQGQSLCAGQTIDIIDLPGTYSLSHPDSGAKDEAIACQYLLNHSVDLIINIIDATHLERHLYLTSQLLELGVPVIVVLNMMDLAEAKGLVINTQQLATLLRSDVVSMNAYRGDGLTQLQTAIANQLQADAVNQLPLIRFPDALEKTLNHLQYALSLTNRAQAFALLESDYLLRQRFDETIHQTIIQPCLNECATSLDEEVDLFIADKRYQQLHVLTEQVVEQHTPSSKLSRWRTQLDKWILHRVLALPIFLLIMYSMFFFAINIGGLFQDFFDMSSEAIFVHGFADLLQAWHCPTVITVMLTAGVGKGINTTLTFIPIVMAMFFALAFLEDSGYMARAAFVIDRLMRYLGLPGKSFVPMIVGFGCNVPAVMAARTLETHRDRVLTIMMSPFMSCSARLAIYAIFTAAFFPQGGQNVVFGLYLTGIVMAVLTGFLLRHTLLPGEVTPLILELPAYHLPSLQGLWRQTWQRTKGFLFRAGKMIVPVCMLVGLLGSLDTTGHIISSAEKRHSMLATVARGVTPIFHPMGIHQDNWPATVGLLTGVVAKEVVVATLNTLYMEDQVTPTHTTTTETLTSRLRDAWLTIPANIQALPKALLNPVLGALPDAKVNDNLYGVMIQRFAGPASAIAYLLFVLLYIPCVSTIAVIHRELNLFWATLSVTWNTLLAYGVAVGFYQLAISNMSWLILSEMMLILMFAMALIWFRSKRVHSGGRHGLARTT